MLLAKVKDFSALMESKQCIDEAVKNKQEPYEKLVEMSRNDDDTKGDLDYLYH